ncbi:MAG: EAL domain-containing protein [Lachnospiraceae bacterium]|nr:EAL domain-containing protein [Lachnospiraceae bacterium]
MNIQVQCCGVVVLILIWYFSLRKRPLGLETVKLFLVTLGMNSFCILMDILSIVAICYRDRISGFLLALICKTYVLSLIWVGYFELLYSSADFMQVRAERKKRNRIYTVLVLMATFLIYLLPIHYYQKESIVYTYGPSCIAAYVFALLFVMVTLYQVGIRGKKMNPKRRRAIVVWVIIWILAAVTQFLNARLLLVGFASVLGMVILFFELENPEANLDRETGAYNAHALGEYIKMLYDKQEAFSAILLSWDDTMLVTNGNRVIQADLTLQGIVRYVEKIQDVIIFKTLERELVLFTADELRMQEVFRDVKDHIETVWQEKMGDGQNVPICYVMLPNSLMLRNVEELIRILRHFRASRGENSEENSILLDEMKIGQYMEREETDQLIRSAIEEDRIEVFYQPIYSTQQERFVSAEALVRIRDLDGSMISPGRFIPIAEKNGLISQIGEIVFRKVCDFIQSNQLREQYGIKYLEVNLSVRQCENPQLADNYIRIMEQYALDPSCINLEITESASIRTRTNLLENMRKLMDYGVKFSLDDFGNGESNLNYIVDMPVSIVKFDRDMSQAYFANQKAKFVMEASMQMIHDLELEIVSEGVETKEQMETIAALGIEYIQGYYFSKPLPGEEFLEFIRAKAK